MHSKLYLVSQRQISQRHNLHRPIHHYTFSPALSHLLHELVHVVYKRAPSCNAEQMPLPVAHHLIYKPSKLASLGAKILTECLAIAILLPEASDSHLIAKPDLS